MEHYDLVNTVQEFGPQRSPEQFHNLTLCSLEPVRIFRSFLHAFLNQVRSGIGCHYQDGIFEIGHPAFVVCKTTVIKHLQQNVEYIRMGFLYLVK